MGFEKIVCSIACKYRHSPLGREQYTCRGHYLCMFTCFKDFTAQTPVFWRVKSVLNTCSSLQCHIQVKRTQCLCLTFREKESKKNKETFPLICNWVSLRSIVYSEPSGPCSRSWSQFLYHYGTGSFPSPPAWVVSLLKFIPLPSQHLITFLWQFAGTYLCMYSWAEGGTVTV